LILTDREMRIALEKRFIEIDPEPISSAFSSTSVDLTLGTSLTGYLRPDSAAETSIDPTRPGFNPETSLEMIAYESQIEKEGYLLEPGQLHLGWTQEVLNLKTESRLAARIEGKSSLARIGLGIHITAPTIHCGFRGRVRLEIMNHGPVPIRLRSGMKIAQLIFETTLGTPEKGYGGKYLDQDASKISG
jgi:dCTP deaminase